MNQLSRLSLASLMICALMLTALSACTAPESSVPESQPPETSVSDVTSEITTAETSLTETIPQKNPVTVIDPDAIQFPDTITEITGFRWSDFAGDGGYVKLICMLDENVYLEARESGIGDTGNLYYYQYNIRTGESEKFEGCVQDFSMSADSWALVGDCLYGTIETPDVQVHYQIDLQNKKVTPLKTVPLNRDTDSFVYTYAVDDESYIETAFILDMEQKMYTYHVVLYAPDGEKEIITKSGNHRNEFYVYRACGGKIYEYSQKKGVSGAYLSTYDTNGDLLSSDYLAEVTDALTEAPDAYLDHFLVTDQFMAFNLGYEMPTEKCIVYNRANAKVTVIEDARFLKSPQSTSSDSVYAMIAHAKTDTEKMSLCFWDGDETCSGILRGLDLSFSAVHSNKTVVCLNGQKLYRFDAQ